MQLINLAEQGFLYRPALSNGAAIKPHVAIEHLQSA